MMKESSLQTRSVFPIALYGHTLKYEIECICKLFLPVTKFQFHYDTESLPETALDGALLSLHQLEAEQKTIFSVLVQYQGQALTETKSFPYCNPVEDKALCEYRFSAILYRILEKLTDLHPAWGLLTGIRPVKKVQPYLNRGLSKGEIIQALKEKYWITEEKLELAYNTAVVQAPLLQQTPDHSVSLYVSIPFCPTRCSYCSFVSHSVEQAKSLIPLYLDKLCQELVLWAELIREENLVLDTIYFGGGTPTSLSATQLEKVLSTINCYFDLSNLREYCVEAGRPDTITLEKLKVLRQFHVDRISVNPQTMQDSVLKTIGRNHTTQQTIEAFQMAREAGFENINMDLIAGLPGDNPEGFHDTLNQILKLDPDSITVHALTLKRAATLFSQGATQVHNPVQQMVQESMKRLPDSGYTPYYMYRQKNTIDNQENVGYAKPGKESLYNILIMDESQSIFGAGCGASTKLVEPCGRITRIHNYKFPYEYTRQFDQLMEKKQQVREICKEIRKQEGNAFEEK